MGLGAHLDRVAAVRAPVGASRYVVPAGTGFAMTLLSLDVCYLDFVRALGLVVPFVWEDLELDALVARLRDPEVARRV